MKIKRKFWNRITAFVCALILAVSCMGSVPYYADDVYVVNGFYDSEAEDLFNSRTNYTVFEYEGVVCVLCYNGYSYKSYSWGYEMYAKDCGSLYLKSGEWDCYSSGSGSAVLTTCAFNFYNWQGFDVSADELLNYIVYSDIEIKGYDGTVYCPVGYNPNFSGSAGNENYNSSLGYLQNISYRLLWETGEVTYYYDDSSSTELWSFDSLTTTGVDLTAGNYSIRHYIQPCLVTGYKEEDIVEEYDKYFMGEYDAADLSFQYKSADYDKKLEEYGYEGLGFFDSLIGRFIIRHQLFQIVNNDTGEIGGYVILRPENADNSSFGVEYLAKTVTPDGDLDLENGYDDTIIDYSSGSGSTLEEAIDNSNEPSFDSLAGVEAFTNSLNSFSKSLGNVPLGLKSIIDLFPWWVQASFGLSFALAFLLLLYKVFR